MRLLSVFGTRPQLIKLAPFCRAVADHNRNVAFPIEHMLVDTGQHYHSEMSDIFFDQLKIPKAHVDLNVGSGPHGQQTGRMLERIEQVLCQQRPDQVVVYGDTNSTVAGALAATKLGIPVAHVEAGLRSFNRQMPEEINRVVTDHLSDLLLAPTHTAMKSLSQEGLSKRSVFCGDLMYDAVLYNRRLAADSKILRRLALSQHQYGVVTIHRAENTNNVVTLQRLLDGLNEFASDTMKLVFPMHPRTQKVLEQLDNWRPGKGFMLIEPLGSFDMLALIDQASLIMTDSGGLQKEAFFLGCPCVTLREETEWPETVMGQGNRVVGTDPGAIREAANQWLRVRAEGQINIDCAAEGSFGGGDAAVQALKYILEGL